MKQKDFDRIIKANFEEVKTWSKWKQKIIITAEASSTGKFIMSEAEWKKSFGGKK